MQYYTGREIRIGDQVLSEYGKVPGVVVHIIETDSDVQLWQLQEPGVMIEGPVFGWLFVPTSMLDSQYLEFVANG